MPCRDEIAIYDAGTDVIVQSRVESHPTERGGQGTPYVQSDFSTITVSLFRIQDGVAYTVPSYDGASLTVSAVIFNTLQDWDEDSRGFNFEHKIDADDLLPTATYEARYRFNLTSGKSFSLRQEFLVQGPVDAPDFPFTGWRGEWNNSDSYFEGDVVEHEGSSWRATNDNTNSEPPDTPAGASADWELVAAKGETGAGTTGASGAGYAATSTSSIGLATGPAAWTTQSGLAYSVGARVRVSSSASTANYAEGLVTGYSGTTLSVNVDLVGGSGTFASWNINLAGDRGATGATGTGTQGDDGPGYRATSTTSVTVGTGTKAFVTQGGLAYTVGARVRVTNTADTSIWMEGLVSAYSTGSGVMLVAVDLSNGSGTLASWNINLAGQQGQGFDHTGAWSSLVAYLPYDVVSYLGSSYVCVTANTNQPPPNANWDVWAEKGEDGSATEGTVVYEFSVTRTAYGAAGDGTTDDTAAIQACVDAAIAAGGPQTVFFPPGTYMVQDAGTGDYSGSSGGAIRIPSGATDITLLGPDAVLLVGPNGLSESTVRCFGSRCKIIGFTRDLNANIGSDPSYRYLKDNSGFEVNGSLDVGVDGLDCSVIDCKCINGYGQDDALAQVNNDFLFTNVERANWVRCSSDKAGWNAFRCDGDAWMIDCTATNFRGQGLRVNEGTIVFTRGNYIKSNFCHGRTGILIDAGSSPGSEARTTQVFLDDNYAYVNPDGTGLGTDALPEGACSALKVGSSSFVQMRGGYYGAGDAAENYALRLEDSLRSFVAEGARIDPNVIFTPSDNDEGSIYQGLVVSIADNGSGKCRITVEGTGNPVDPPSPSSSTGEGLRVGKSMFVHGSANAAFNREHIVKTRISDYVFDTDIDYVSGTAGSSCYARTGVDSARFINCEFGNDTFGETGSNQLPIFFSNTAARVFEIQGCRFNQLGETTGSVNAIDWLCQYDAGFELIRIVDNDWTFNTTGAARMINPDTAFNATSLTTSGKIISHSNRLVNLGGGGATLANAAAANYNRQILFSTDGESKTRYIWTTPPNASDVRTTFDLGSVVLQRDTTQPGTYEWLCTATGTSGSVAPSFVLRDAPYKFISTANGTPVASTAAETSATPTGIGDLRFGYLRALTVGEAFQITAAGVYSTTGTPTLGIAIKLGKVGETGATTLGSLTWTTPSGASNLKWRLRGLAIVKAIGSSGTVQFSGMIAYETSSGVWVENHLAATDVTVNTSNATTHNRKVDVSIDWQTSSSSNTAQCTQFEVKPW